MLNSTFFTCTIHSPLISIMIRFPWGFFTTQWIENGKISLSFYYQISSSFVWRNDKLFKVWQFSLNISHNSTCRFELIFFLDFGLWLSVSVRTLLCVFLNKEKISRRDFPFFYSFCCLSSTIIIVVPHSSTPISVFDIKNPPPRSLSS